MLHNAKQIGQASLSRLQRMGVLGTLAVVACLMSGLRGPEAGSSIDPGDQLGTATGGPPAFDLSFLPDEVAYVVMLRPADLSRKQSVGELLSSIIESSGQAGARLKELQLGVSDVEELAFGVSTLEPKAGGPPFDFLFARARKSGAWNKLVEKLRPDAIEMSVQGKAYLKPKSPTSGPQAVCLALMGSNTLVVATEHRMHSILTAGGSTRTLPAWADVWTANAKGPAALMVDLRKLRKLIEMDAMRLPESAALLSPLWQEANQAFFFGVLDPAISVRAIALCPSEESAKKVRDTTQAALTLAGNGLDLIRKQPREAKMNEAIDPLMGLAVGLLKNARLEQKQAQVSLVASLTEEATKTAFQILPPALLEARKVAAKARSQNNLKQIGLALHNYHAAYQTFPAAAVLGPDGKTVHSWRVAILPFIDQAALYQQYRLNEPWDSENNRKVLAKMPAVYQIGDEPSSTSSYFAFVGKDAIFSEKQPVQITEIHDGTSNTIMIAEAKRSIPWTKPEDIRYDANQPVPQLGGWYSGGFNAAFADGSVRFLPLNLPEATLRALITKAGGEPIQGIP